MNAVDLIESVAQSLEDHVVDASPIAVGLSGGIDSVVLLDILVELRASKRLAPNALQAIHVHHGLSPNADQWLAFCEKLCLGLDVDFQSHRIAVARDAAGGVESAARAARYAAFASSDAQVIALAHHADDQAETVLHQLLRGTGLQGMAGMGARRVINARQVLVRPMLGLTRVQIEHYAAERGLEWIEDESNVDTAFTRNFLRHDVMPLLETRFPHYRESLARGGSHAAEASELTEALAREDLKAISDRGAGPAEVTVGMLDGYSLVRQCNALYWWLRWCDVARPSHAQLEEWARVLFRPSPDDKPHQAGGHDYLIVRRRDRLMLRRRDR